MIAAAAEEFRPALVAVRSVADEPLAAIILYLAGGGTATCRPTGFSIGHNVGSREEVDAVMAQARQAGATMTKEAQPTVWGGWAGYFQDPDGHLWEVVWNPAWEDSG